MQIKVAAFALIFNDENQVLLVDHFLSEKKPKGLSNCWAMPGGTIEFGETAEEALKREIKEELDVEITGIKQIGYNEYIKLGKHWIGINFTARTKSKPKNVEPEKIREMRFFRLDKIPENISEFTRECLLKINQKSI